jgi:hypothetical protein
MAEGSPHITQQEFVYIDLDDPSPWWASTVGVVAVALIVAVLVAPWMIDWEDGSTSQVAAGTLEGTSSVCRPNSTGLPSFLDPTVASWNRFCEWFVEPGADTP